MDNFYEPVKLRKSRPRDKSSSIYSRYIKPNIFSFKNKSADPAVNCNKTRNMTGGDVTMYKNYSYADTVKGGFNKI